MQKKFGIWYKGIILNYKKKNMKWQKILTKFFEYLIVAVITYLITYFFLSNNVITIANPILALDIPILNKDISTFEVEAQTTPFQEITNRFRLLDLEYYAQFDFDVPVDLNINLNTGPRLLDLEYYTQSDFDIPLHLDPNLDASICIVNSLDIDSISISSLPVGIPTQEITYATTDNFIQAALAEEEKYTHLKIFGVDHPYVDACINYHSATAKQLRAMEDVSAHRDSFMQHDIFPDVLEWLSDTA